MLLDIDQAYCDEIIRIFQEKKKDDELANLAKLYSEVNLGEEGGNINKKKKNKHG
jgi:hypothetical protein